MDMEDGEFSDFSDSSDEKDVTVSATPQQQHTSFLDHPTPHVPDQMHSVQSSPSKPRRVGPGPDVLAAFEARSKRKVIWRYWTLLVLTARRLAARNRLRRRYLSQLGRWKAAKLELGADVASAEMVARRVQLGEDEAAAREGAAAEEVAGFDQILAQRDELEAIAAYEKAKLAEELFRQEGIEPPPTIASSSPITQRSESETCMAAHLEKQASGGAPPKDPKGSAASSAQHSPTSSTGRQPITARTSSAMVEPERAGSVSGSDSDAAPATIEERRISAAVFAAARRSDADGQSSKHTSPSQSAARARPASAPAKRGAQPRRPPQTSEGDAASGSSDEHFGELLVNPTGAYGAKGARRVSPTAQSAVEGDASGAGAVYAAPLSVIHPTGASVAPIQGSAAWGWRRKRPEWEAVSSSTRMPSYNAASDPHCRQLFERPPVRRHITRTDKETRKAQQAKKTAEDAKLAWRFLVHRTYGRHNQKRPKPRPKEAPHPRVALHVGGRLIIHSGRRDRPCVVLDIADDGVKVRYEGHSEEYDELIPWRSERLKDAKTPSGDPVRFKHPMEYDMQEEESVSPTSDAPLEAAAKRDSHRPSAAAAAARRSVAASEGRRVSSALPSARRSVAGSRKSAASGGAASGGAAAASRPADSRRPSAAAARSRQTSRAAASAAAVSRSMSATSRSSSVSTRSSSSSYHSRAARSDSSASSAGTPQASRHHSTAAHSAAAADADADAEPGAAYATHEQEALDESPTAAPAAAPAAAKPRSPEARSPRSPQSGSDDDSYEDDWV